MFLVPIAYTHMCVYRRLLTPSGNMFDTGQQTGSVVITAGQISQSFAAWITDFHNSDNSQLKARPGDHISHRL